MKRLGLFVREVIVSAWAQRVFSLVTLLIVLGSTVAIMATNGRAAASEAAVLGTFAAEDTRTIMVDVAKPEGQLTTRHVDHLAALPQTVTVLGFGTTVDYRAAANDAGPKIAVREVYGEIDGKPAFANTAGGALVSKEASRTAGLPPGRGSLAAPLRTELLIDGELTTPAFLQGLEPLAVQPLSAGTFQEPGVPNRVSTIRVLCDSPASVALVTEVAKRLTSHNPPGSILVNTSEELATLQGAVAGTLSAQSHGIVLGVIAGSLAAVCVNVWGLALARRKDYGRRRALGASRTLVAGLIVGQVLVIAVLGVSLALVGCYAWFSYQGMHVPTATYSVTLAALLTMGAAFAALVPAIGASLRDPITELRVP